MPTEASTGKSAAATASPDPKMAAVGSEEDEAESARWRPVLGLPCDLTIDLPLPGFRVGDLLQLQSGSVIGTSWQLARDVPLRVNGTLIGWSEFEVVGDRLAARLTELA